MKLLKMIQDKRIKILILVIFLVLNAIQSNPMQPPELDFIIKRIEPLSEPFISPVCISYGNNTGSAIGWIYPIPTTESDLPVDETVFLPVKNSNYNCDFSNNIVCNNFWKLQGWQQSKLYTNNFEPTLDTRWEGLKTILSTNETDADFSHKFDIPATFTLGISVRISRNAQILFCEGWNPNTYPCYYLNIGFTNTRTVTLYKFNSISQFKANEELCKYQSDIDVVSEDEWRNFALKLDRKGEIIIEDIQRGVLLNCTDSKPLQPIFLILRSPNTNGLWKIHNNKYLYTDRPQTTQLGPGIKPIGGKICISMYVAMCETCSMSFFTQISQKQVIQVVSPSENVNKYTKWREIKLEQNYEKDESVFLFVETKNELQTRGFWAIDNVRTCYKNEIKITTLDLKQQTNETVMKLPFSCQVLDNPKWRPTPSIVLVDPRVEKSGNFTLNLTETSITISNLANVEKEWYITHYEARDLCDSFNQRDLSHGYVISEGDIHVTNLIPFTVYKLTIEYVLQSHTFDYEFTTLGTKFPTKYEIPKNVRIEPTDTTVTIAWKDRMCNETFGEIIYQLKVEKIGTNLTKTINSPRSEYQFVKLKPYSNYTLTISTGRSLQQIHSNLSLEIAFNFTTLPGPPFPIENVEVYANNRTTVSIRYDLPQVVTGQPESVQIIVCNITYTNSCTSRVKPIEKCPLWNDKYCIIIDRLEANLRYMFQLALKVKDVKQFGERATIQAKTINRIPGRPSNITYEMLDCNRSEDFCHLKLSWSHPYYQNGDISLFQILLFETSSKGKYESEKVIHEILKIDKYEKFYSIIVKYIPYSTHYNVSIRAMNNQLKGEYESQVIKTDSIEDYIDQTPQFIQRTNQTLTFQLPPFDWRLKSSDLIIIVQDNDKTNANLNQDILQLNVFNNETRLCQNFGNNWITKAIKIDNTSPRMITIGDGSLSYLTSVNLNKSVKNVPLQPGKFYCLTFLIKNEYREVENQVIYHIKDAITEENTIPVPEKTEIQYNKSRPNYVIILLTCATILCCIAWIYYRRRIQKRQRDEQSTNGTNSEPVYETMPFDDYECDAVFNRTYDKLIHE